MTVLTPNTVGCHPTNGQLLMQVHGGLWEPTIRNTYYTLIYQDKLTRRSRYDGVPAVANSLMLNDILRGEWDYQYYVISDAGATDRLCNTFKMCEANPIDSDAVTLAALPAGTDVEMGGGS